MKVLRPHFAWGQGPKSVTCLRLSPGIVENRLQLPAGSEDWSDAMLAASSSLGRESQARADHDHVLAAPFDAAHDHALQRTQRRLLHDLIGRNTGFQVRLTKCVRLILRTRWQLQSVFNRQWPPGGTAKQSVAAKPSS